MTPQKIFTKSSYPQKYAFLLKSPKNIELHYYDPPPPNGPNLRMYENIRVPPPPGDSTPLI